MVVTGGMQQDDQATQGNGQQPEQKDDQNRRPPYSMHGVLHYLQHEWSKYEMEKSKWEMERVEMQARISFLNGERKGQENLKADLIRRIKMLEYCLKEERAKNYRLTHNGEEMPMFEEADTDDAPEAALPTEVDAYTGESGSILGWKQGRQLLKQYLQEIGYSEKVMDVRSFRVKNLLGLIPEGEWPSSERVSGGGKSNAGGAKREDDSDYELEDSSNRLDSETTEALNEFNFLSGKDDSGKPRDEWSGADQGAVTRLKEKYKSEKRNKRNSSGSGTSDDDERRYSGGKDEMVMPLGAPKGKRREFMDINDALGLNADDAIDIKDDFGPNEDDDSLRVPKWNPKITLRSHLDSIRAMQFHPVEPVLFTASEDSTIKMWNLDGGKKEEKHGAGSDGVEPVYTFRGHLGPVLCMDLSPTGDNLYTGGHDGTVCCWNVPSSNIDQHETYDPKVLPEKLVGHGNIVWSVAYHSSDNRLVSASSDGTIKLWEPGNFVEPLLRTFESRDNGNAVPTSVDFVSTEPSQLLAAYTQSIARIIDIETGDVLRTFDFGDESAGLITRILSHPTMPLTIVAGEDRKLRYFDNNTGKLVHSAVAHVEGISCLAIDPNGLYLLSGSHDGSLRLWNMEKRVCLQEISAHRKKYDSSVNCVAFHPSRPLIGSAGADAIAKVFSSGQE